MGRHQFLSGRGSTTLQHTPVKPSVAVQPNRPSIEHELAGAKAELEDLRALHSRTVADTKSENEALRVGLEALQQSEQACQSFAHQLQAEKDKAVAEKADAEKELARLQEAVKASQDDYEKELAQLQKDIEAMKEDHNKELAQLQKEVKKAKATSKHKPKAKPKKTDKTKDDPSD